MHASELDDPVVAEAYAMSGPLLRKCDVLHAVTLLAASGVNQFTVIPLQTRMMAIVGYKDISRQ